MKVDRNTPPRVSDFETMVLPVPEVEILKSGLRFIYLNGGVQPVSKLSLYIPGGICELDNMSLARQMAMMIFEGCRDMDDSEIADQLDFFGARVAARATSHYLCVEISMINQRVADILAVVARVLASPTMPATNLIPIKSAEVAAVMTSLQNPTAIANEAFVQKAYGENHPAARPLTKEQIEAVTPEELRGAYTRVFSPAGITAFLAGRLDKATIDSVRDFLNDLPALSSGVGVNLIQYSPVVPFDLVVPGPPSLQSALILGIPVIGRNHPDYIPLRLAVMALGGYFGSRLMSNVREDKGLTYGISAVLLGDREGARVCVAASCDKKNVDLVKLEIDREIERLVSDPPRGEELHRLRLHAVSDLADIVDSPFNIIDFYRTQLVTGFSDDYFDRQQQAVRSLSPEMIADVARRYLLTEKRIIVTTE